ncbi:MAG: UpxY family transcription antiterminator [Alistipes sp.]|nr:UpxY family transcription antiterminator [Alistipes sp.]
MALTEPKSNDSAARQERIAPEAANSKTHPASCWFVLRDLKRANAKMPAYRHLSEECGLEVFIPMRWCLALKKGQKIRKEVPFIQDLLFVRTTREVLDPIVERTRTLQYRYVKGGGYCQPLVVKNDDMDRFIAAVKSSVSPQYYLPAEITPGMVGKRVRIIGGPLDGHEGNLLSIRGLKKKKLLVDLPGVLAVSVEVSPDYLQLL